MATTHAAKEQWRAVRRCVLGGELDKAKLLLQEMQAQYPEDKEIADELHRLLRGLPLHCTETPQQRKQRCLDETLRDLASDVGAHSAKQLAEMRTEDLQQLRKRLKASLRLLMSNKTPAPLGTNAYKKALEQELAKRRRKSLRSRLVIGGALLLLLGGAGGTAWLLHRHADRLAQQLADARRAQDWDKTDLLQRALDTGINKLIHPEVRPLLKRISIWQQETKAIEQRLSAQMHIYERRDAISTLSLQERATFLRQIRALPPLLAKKLLDRWEALCRPEKEKIDQQREALLAELQKAAVFPQLENKAAEDLDKITKAQAYVQQVIADFESTRDAFDLSAEMAQPNKKLLTRLEGYRSEIEQLLRTEQQLRAARNYAQHLKAFKNLQDPTCYPPAQKAAEAARLLPAEERVYSEVRAHRFNIPKHIPDTVVQALVNKGPTFCQTHPASLPQLHLMENIFTSRTLRQKVYEIFRTTGEVHYSDQSPTPNEEKNSVAFTISELDPAYSVDKSPRIEWENAHATVWSRLLDATPILKATNITRERFFLEANVPDVLGRITAIHDKNCPPLAKAYVYHTLLELLRQHAQQPDITGVRYSPTLQEDMASFLALSARCKLPLTPSCWLSRNSAVLEAENLYSQWFDKHADRDYAAEISQNFARILRSKPRYVGKADAEGKMHLQEPVSPKMQLWYLSDGKLCIGAPGGPMKQLQPYSPIFAN